jgi:hypothetical protein
MSQEKCQLCWAKGPPYPWEKSQAPTIPSTKPELIAQLQEHGISEDLQALHKHELKHMFRQHIRGERHPSDCTKGMGSMSLGDLRCRASDHGLTFSLEMSKGHLQTLLRGHWHQQCAHAKDEAADFWEVIPSQDDNDTQSAMTKFQLARENMWDAFRQIQLSFGQDPKHKETMDAAVHAFETFLLAMDRLEDETE